MTEAVETPEEMQELAQRIDDFLRRARGDRGGLTFDRSRPDPVEGMLLSLEANRMILGAMSARLLGECRVEKPYKPLRPIIDENGNFRWCCTHSTPHCG